MDVELRDAIQTMLDDHMTSETHHPGYVLVPTAAFEKARAAILSERRSFPQEHQRTQDLTDGLKSLNDAMRYILAFYEPGQTHLDTNAWKLAEAEARAAHAEATTILAALSKAGV